jgi:hypothetical protein
MMEVTKKQNISFPYLLEKIEKIFSLLTTKTSGNPND